MVIGDVIDAEGEQTAAALEANGLAVHFLHLDVTSRMDWRRVIADVVERFGGLDVLVNNAGIAHDNPLLEETLEDWNALLAVNATGVLLGMQTAIPAMQARGGGSIINVSSILGLTGGINSIAYCASKGAVEMMTKTAALEHAVDKIRINALCPGGVRTPMSPQAGGGVVPFTPMGRKANVREVTGAVLFLASDDSTFVTGADIVVDGGYLAH